MIPADAEDASGEPENPIFWVSQKRELTGISCVGRRSYLCQVKLACHLWSKIGDIYGVPAQERRHGSHID
jgi:hypothetical protein